MTGINSTSLTGFISALLITLAKSTFALLSTIKWTSALELIKNQLMTTTLMEKGLTDTKSRIHTDSNEFNDSLFFVCIDFIISKLSSCVCVDFFVFLLHE